MTAVFLRRKVLRLYKYIALKRQHNRCLCREAYLRLKNKETNKIPMHRQHIHKKTPDNFL